MSIQKIYRQQQDLSLLYSSNQCRVVHPTSLPRQHRGLLDRLYRRDQFQDPRHRRAGLNCP